MKHSRSCLRSTALVIMGWMLALATLGAQAGNGTLTGTVVDAQGAALPGAVVAVTEEATGAVRTMPSNHEGVFRLAGPAARTLSRRSHDGRLLAAEADGRVTGARQKPRISATCR